MLQMSPSVASSVVSVSRNKRGASYTLCSGCSIACERGRPARATLAQDRRFISKVIEAQSTFLKSRHRTKVYEDEKGWTEDHYAPQYLRLSTANSHSLEVGLVAREVSGAE